jgi:hypothetical protein
MRTNSDEFMEDKSEFDFEQIISNPLSIVNKPFIPVELICNLLSTGNEPIQPIQIAYVYVFPKTFVAYAQHESLKQIILFL